MELKCPQCGKWMAVSQEELVLHDCQVVCPQCLAVCHYENGVLVVRDDSDAPYRHNASVSTAEPDNSRYCYSCGRKLPEGISFCPYCGVDLKTPFVEEPHPTPEVKHEEPVPTPEQPVQHEEVVKPAREPQAPKPVQQASQVEQNLRTITHRYSGMHPQMHHSGDKPSTVFRAGAYVIILLLLVLLAYIIYSGLSIEMPEI